MSDEKTEIASTEPIRVSIFNQIYSLRSHSGEEHVKRIAQLVDERMRQVALQAPNHDLLKVAVLTALNIADELQRIREQYEKQYAPPPPDAEGAPEPPEDKTKQREGEPQSWYEDLFDSRTGGRRNDERLSTLISSKLQMLRQPNHEAVTIEADEDERLDRSDKSETV